MVPEESQSPLNESQLEPQRGTVIKLLCLLCTVQMMPLELVHHHLQPKTSQKLPLCVTRIDQI